MDVRHVSFSGSTTRTVMSMLESLKNFFRFSYVDGRLILDGDRKTIEFMINSETDKSSKNHNILPFFTQNSRIFDKTSFVSWIHGPLRRSYPQLQHFLVHLTLTKIVENYLPADAEIDADLWYLREILASWHRIIEYMGQLVRSVPSFILADDLRFLLDKLSIVPIMVLFSCQSESSTTPLGLLPGNLLFRLSSCWKEHQQSQHRFFKASIELLWGKLEREAKKHSKILLEISSSDMMVQNDFPFLHHLHYFHHSEHSIIRRRLMEKMIIEVEESPSTITRADLWKPPPLLRNANFSWTSWLNVIFHFILWELDRVESLLRRMEDNLPSGWSFNWSQLHFPSTRLFRSVWTAEGEIYLHVGLLPPRNFQFVQPLLPHDHILQVLKKMFLETSSENWWLPGLLLQSLFSTLSLQLKNC